MAGRGGKTSTLTREQLQSMGVSGKEITPSSQLPPPLYPPLVNKPGPPDDNMERQYKIMWKEDFVNFLKESPYYSVAKLAKGEFHTTEGAAQKPKEKPNYCWNLMPPELKPNFKRAAATPKASTVLRPALVKRNRTDKTVDEKLKLLEEKEKQGVTAVGAPKIKTETVDAEDEEMDEGGVEDDEMDDENDYGNSYFDNGESFNDDDDNLDDGPVY